MKTEQISLVMAITRERSISKAAQALSISQPSASNMLKSLERELGFALFERTRVGAIPTDAGCEFIEYAESIERSLQAIGNIHKPGRRISLKILTGKGETTERAFEQLCEKYLLDDCAVSLSYQVVSNFHDALRMVNAGNGDIAIAQCRKDLYESEVRASTDRQLGAAKIGTLRLELTCVQGHPLVRNGVIAYDLLNEYPCFSSVDPSQPEPFVSVDLSRLFRSIQRNVIMDHGDARYRLLRKSNGYLISAPVPALFKETYGLVSLPVKRTQILVYAVYRKDPQKQALIDEYIATCRELMNP